MATSAQYESQLDAINKQLQGYSKDLPGQIKSEIEQAWTPGLERATGETQRQMSEYLPKFWNLASDAGGTTAADLSPQQKLAMMGRELGTMSGRLNATQSVSDYLGGQMRELYSQAQQSAQLGQQNLADEYNRMFNLFQLAKQEEEAARQRALQERLAQLQFRPNNPNNETPTPTGPRIDIQEERYNAFKKKGMSDEEAYQYATQGIPEDTPGALGTIRNWYNNSAIKDWYNNDIGLNAIRNTLGNLFNRN